MRAPGPQGSMGPWANERGQTGLGIRVKPLEILASEVVMEERQWKAGLSARQNALGPERLIAAAASIQKSETVKRGVDVQRGKKAASLRSEPGDDPRACVPV